MEVRFPQSWRYPQIIQKLVQFSIETNGNLEIPHVKIVAVWIICDVFHIPQQSERRAGAHATPVKLLQKQPPAPPKRN